METHNNLNKDMSDKYMWEILVPTKSNIGVPFRTRYHRVWDEKVRKISGGLTILQPAKGQWINKENSIFIERMIPVRIIATREDIDKIIDLTIEHYNQEAVLCYRVADLFILKNRKN